MNQKDKIHDALNLLDDDLLQEVDELRRKAPKRTAHIWYKFGAMAACLCLLVGGVFAASGFWPLIGSEKMSAGGSREEMIADGTAEKGDAAIGAVKEEASEEEMMLEKAEVDDWEESYGEDRETAAPSYVITEYDSVVIPPMQVDLCNHIDVNIDMVSFFIYQGRCYELYGTLTDASQLIGEKLGSATGLINEWTKKDGYVELAGSVKGDFYSVSGLETDFVLCMPQEDGTVQIYLNNSDMTLYTGADILKDRFKINGQFTAHSISRERWFYSEGEPCELSEEAGEQLWALIESMCEAPFIYSSDIPLPEGANSLYDTEIFRLYLTLENGMVVQLRLFDGGFVQLEGLRPVCMQVEVGTFYQTVKYLEAAESSLSEEIVMEDQ